MKISKFTVLISMHYYCFILLYGNFHHAPGENWSPVLLVKVQPINLRSHGRYGDLYRVGGKILITHFSILLGLVKVLFRKKFRLYIHIRWGSPELIKSNPLHDTLLLTHLCMERIMFIHTIIIYSSAFLHVLHPMQVYDAKPLLT